MDANKEEDEEFYERIEAPKFVDFTKLYTYRTDEYDRYWFCSRVGCDQKHEEEINPKEISKNFVLRVMAARSPNIKLRKELYKEHTSIKCPLSAPAKPSKPKIPRLATVDPLISHKNGDPQSKTGPCSKVGSTPVPKSRQVASKYMTTPRNKMIQPNHNSVLSVENPKNGNAHNKNGTRSKVGSTPMIRSRQVDSKYMTTPSNKMSRPNRNSFLSVQNPKASTVDVAKIRTVAKGLVFHSPKKAVSLKKSGELHTPSKTNKKEEDLKLNETSATSDSHALRGEMNDLSNTEDKENVERPEDYSNVYDKENALNAQDNNRSNNQTYRGKILNKEIQKKNKIVQTAGPVVMKCKKPKPTNIKPFRLRTDERGILKEGILERKFHPTAPEEEVAKDKRVIKRTNTVPKIEKLSASDNCGTRSQSVRMPGQQLGEIEDNSSSKLTSDVKVVKDKTRLVSATRSTSRGKRHVTVAKEPNFHTSHLPRACSKKIS